MQIALNDWINFKDKLTELSQIASDKLSEYVDKNGGYDAIPVEDIISYAYALVQKYGEGAATLSALMYDAIAELSNANVPEADVADVSSYGEVAKAIQGASKSSINALYIGAVAGRLVKLAGADTMLKNAKRDNAQIAWISFGDTCAYCIMQAAKGWINVPPDAIKGGHAEHIHGNCDCTYSVRFDNDTFIRGYNPNKYQRMYSSAEGDTQREKLNSMRREFYAENSEKINEQKRSAYEKRREREASSAEEMNVNT